MKLKLLSYAALGFMLVGCNDSNKESSVSIIPVEQPPTNPELPPDNGSSDGTIGDYYVLQFQSELYDYAPDRNFFLLRSSSAFTLKDNIYYRDEVEGVNVQYPLADYLALFTYIDQEAIYEADQTKYPNLGYQIAKVISSSNNLLVTTPATKQVSPIQYTHERVWYDLSNKPMTERTSLAIQKNLADNLTKSIYDDQPSDTQTRKNYNQAVKKFTALQKSNIFPSGSKCFITQKITPNREYVKYDVLEEPTGYPNLDVWQSTYASLASKFENKKFSGIDFRVATHVDNYSHPQYFSALKWTDGELYLAEYSEPHLLEKTIAYNTKVIERAKVYLPEEEIRRHEYVTDNLRDSCEAYNKIAADALKKIILEADPKK